MTSVAEFGALGDGIHDDSAALALAIAEATHLTFQPGQYIVSQTLDLGRSGLRVSGSSAVIRHTGAGPAVRIGSGVSIYDVAIEDLTIEGGPGTTDGLVVTAAHHIDLRRIRVRDVGDAALRIRWSVLGTISGFACSVNEQPFDIQPRYGIVIEDTEPGCYSTCLVFDSAIIEGVSATGIWLRAASNCVFLGGTSEHNGRGVEVDRECFRNVFKGLWCEDNTIADIEVSGHGTVIEGVYAGSLAVDYPNVSVIWGQGTIFQGGYLRRVDLQSVSRATLFLGCHVSDHPSLGITGVGPRQAIGVMCVDAAGAYTGMVN